MDRMLTGPPTSHVDIGGRMAELGRQPRAFRASRGAPDRVLFGTDISLSSGGYRLYFRFLETDDEAFAYAPGEEVPPSGSVGGLRGRAPARAPSRCLPRQRPAGPSLADVRQQGQSIGDDLRHRVASRSQVSRAGPRGPESPSDVRTAQVKARFNADTDVDLDDPGAAPPRPGPRPGLPTSRAGPEGRSPRRGVAAMSSSVEARIAGHRVGAAAPPRPGRPRRSLRRRGRPRPGRCGTPGECAPSLPPTSPSSASTQIPRACSTGERGGRADVGR